MFHRIQERPKKLDDGIIIISNDLIVSSEELGMEFLNVRMD